MKIRSCSLLAACVFSMLYLIIFQSEISAAEAGNQKIAISSGQLVYVPVYPSIYYMGRKKSLDLTVTLSIHNISPDRKIRVESIEYFSKKGGLLKKIISEPLTLSPLETTSFVVNEQKTSPGGVGANFMVTWRASKPVNPPVTQAVMITTTGSQGISFITEGVPVRELAP